MGANSIDISQYRSRIGTFAGAGKKLNKASLGKEEKTNTVMESFMILAYLLVLSNVTQNLLIISGVELNPGPFQLDKGSAKKIKDRETNQQIGKVVGGASRKETGVSAAFSPFPTNLPSSTPRIPQPKIDATDRRQLEAINEDKSHSTKDNLDDIRRVHLKEKKKKERKDAERAGTISEGPSTSGSSATTSGASFPTAEKFAWDPKYAMSLKNTKKDKKYDGASLAGSMSSMGLNDSLMECGNESTGDDRSGVLPQRSEAKKKNKVVISEVRRQGGRTRIWQEGRAQEGGKRIGPTIVQFGHGKLKPDAIEMFHPPVVSYHFPDHRTKEYRAQPQNESPQHGAAPSLHVLAQLKDGLTYSSNAPSVKLINSTPKGYTNYLAVRNKKTGLTKLIEANNITLGAVTTPPSSTNPVLVEQAMKTQEVESGDKNKTSLSNVEKKALVREFGQTKGKRSYDQAERMIINPEVLEEKLSKAAMSAEKPKVTNANTTTDVLDYLAPPCNRNATEKELVYSLENGILNQSEIAKLQAAATSLSEELLSDAFIKNGVQTKVFSEFFGKILLREYKEVESINLAIGIYMEAIIKFVGLNRRDFAKGPKGMPNFIPLEIREKVFRTFTNDQNNVVPKTRDSAVCYVIVLALMINKYRIEFSDLTSSVRVKADQLKKLVKVTGARISTDANKTTFVELKLPLENFDPSPFVKKNKNPYSSK